MIERLITHFKGLKATAHTSGIPKIITYLIPIIIGILLYFQNKKKNTEIAKLKYEKEVQEANKKKLEVVQKEAKFEEDKREIEEEIGNIDAKIRSRETVIKGLETELKSNDEVKIDVQKERAHLLAIMAERKRKRKVS
jgi:phage terminase small subunit